MEEVDEGGLQTDNNTVKCLGMPRRYMVSMGGKITRTEDGGYVDYDDYVMLYRLYALHHEQRDALIEAVDAAGKWLSAALDDPMVCGEAKSAFRELLRLSEPPEWFKVIKARQAASKTKGAEYA